MEELRDTFQQEEVEWSKELPFQYWLANIPGIGKKTIRHLLENFQNARAVYQMTEAETKEILKPAQVQAFLESKSNWNVEKEYEKLGKRGICFYPNAHPKFPTKLREIPDIPNHLFVRGKLPDNRYPAIAVIGARRCSEYGRYMAREYGEALAQAGIQVISGLALGVDGISQKGAVETGGTSFGVLGCGVDICYPEENAKLYQMLLTKGGILSEYVPGTLPKANLFPPRNRIISGLADAVLVIEAKEKSGTLITVDMALEQGKEVFALPGRVTDPLSRGCNRLIKQGAGMILSPEDLILEIAGNSGLCKTYDSFSGDAPFKDDTSTPISLSSKGQKVWKALDDYPQTVEELRSKLSDISVPELLQLLMELCMTKGAEQVSSGYYIRKHVKQ